MRIAILILAAAAGGCGQRPLADLVYHQEAADRFEGPQPPPGAPREFQLAPFQPAEWSRGEPPVLPIRGLVLSGGEPWFATDRGMIRGLWPLSRYYSGKRWLPDDRVEGLAPDGEGGIWARTATGFARIHFRPMTLEDKAKLFEERVRARHLRHGLVASSHLERPGDLASSVTRSSDNDGLWTAMYVAAEAFRFAATKSDEARRYARESYRAMERLQTITGLPGFPARSFVRAGESTGGGGEWHPTPEGAWLWKGDTSSDEIDGHFFVAGIYHDLVADEAEKESIRRNIGALMDHIIAHGFHLVDVDGKPTTWGVWSPERLNRDPAWWRDRGLNSLEVLSYLAVAEHITGEPRYRAAARELIEKHGYAENTLEQKVLHPPEEINHSDDELAFLSYYSLLSCERDPRLLSLYRRSLDRSFRAEEPEMNPLWTFIAFASGLAETGEWPRSRRQAVLGRAVQTLRETPLEMIDWRAENSHRRDLERSPNQNRFDRPLARWPLHPAERGVLKYNSDPYQLDAGGGGNEEDDGSFFLLSYWMGRHHGFIAAPGD